MKSLKDHLDSNRTAAKPLFIATSRHHHTIISEYTTHTKSARDPSTTPTKQQLQYETLLKPQIAHLQTPMTLQEAQIHKIDYLPNANITTQN